MKNVLWLFLTISLAHAEDNLISTGAKDQEAVDNVIEARKAAIKTNTSWQKEKIDCALDMAKALGHIKVKANVNDDTPEDTSALDAVIARCTGGEQ